MRVTQLGPNKTELAVNGSVILYSYETPVAVTILTTTYITAERYSRTTSSHIKQWLDGKPYKQVDQTTIKSLVNAITSKAIDLRDITRIVGESV